MTKLLECPFCGSDALKISRNVHTELLRVQCDGCWATSVTSTARAVGVAAWNRRASPTPHIDVMRDYIIRLTKYHIAAPGWFDLAEQARGYIAALAKDGKAPAPEASAERDSA